jgi:hypothetical protein
MNAPPGWRTRRRKDGTVELMPDPGPPVDQDLAIQT